MKKIVLLFLLSAFVFSCSNDVLDDESRPSHTSSLTSNEDVFEVGSFDDVAEIYNIKSSDTVPNLRVGMDLWFITNPNERALTSLYEEDPIQEKILYGYDNMVKGATTRVIFTSEMAKILGLATSTIYHTHLRTLTKKITIPSNYNFFENDSPKCGFSPTSTGTLFNKRGYSTGTGTTTITLTTHIYFVEGEEWGISINKEYPCTGSQLIWNYILWKQ